MNPNQSFCLNPDCLNPDNLPQSRFCATCKSPTTVNGDVYPFQNGNYLVKNLLGQGAFGRAYQAIATNRFDYPCVIKKFIANFPNPSDVQYARDAFQREAKQLLTLKHPQIPTLYEYLSYNLNGVPSLYLVLEWIEGKNLHDVWRSQGNFSQEQARELLLSVLPVLGYLHDNGIIHRDIKPNNIMLQQGTGKYVLIDFGGAKATSGTALASTRAIHTPGYAAIEQLRGMACGASDLYSLAATCVRLMTGIFPEYDQYGNVNDPIYDFLNDRWSWREFLEQKGIRIAPDLVTVLEKSLAARVIDRYQTAAEISQILQSSQTTIPATQIAKPKHFIEDLGGGVQLEMMAIPLGNFKDAEGNIVKIAEPFHMGKYPVTQAQWEAVMGDNPSHFTGQDLPVEEVSWDDCQVFCQKLSQKTGKTYRLPNETEWEYCCRAVTSENAPVMAYCFGNDTNLLEQYAWYDQNSGEKTHPVGQTKPNQFGLYDMHGNVWEWCEDSWSDSYQQPRLQKAYKHTANSAKVMRGGSWCYDSECCRSANRDWADADNSGWSGGLRLVCVGSRISP